MAKRPVYIACEKYPYYEVADIEFEYFSGFAVSQKQKSIKNLHDCFKKLYRQDVLEISTKSTEALGVALSAFNLSMEFDESKRSIESIFQGSKCFEEGGPYIDLYDVSPWKVKKDPRIKTSGGLVGFKFKNEEFGNEPTDYFYNWIYIQALYRNDEYRKEIINYRAFTDIEFNPKKSVNCQAKAAAIAVGLMNANLIEKCMEDKNSFLYTVYRMDEMNSYRQMSLFDPI